MNRYGPREQAEYKIAAILRDLETETGTIVKSLSIENLDVTTIISDRPAIQRAVVLTLEWMPGTNWYIPDCSNTLEERP